MLFENVSSYKLTQKRKDETNFVFKEVKRGEIVSNL